MFSQARFYEISTSSKRGIETPRVVVFYVDPAHTDAIVHLAGGDDGFSRLMHPETTCNKKKKSSIGCRKDGEK